MHRRYIVLLLVCLGCSSLGNDVLAKGGRRGGSKGGGKGHLQQPQTGNPRGGKSQVSGSHRDHSAADKVRGDRTGKSGVSRGDRHFPSQSPGSQSPGRFADGDHPREMQKLVEDRKLDQRRKVADHLRQLGDRNGNDQLKEVADRMDASAQEHYERRMGKMAAEDSVDDDPSLEHSVLKDPERRLENTDHVTDRVGDRVRDFGNPDERTREVAKKLTGRENALSRQLRNEERNLAHRMQAAEQLRSLGELQGDEQLLQAADRLEDEALSHYTKRLQKIAEFQDRFGLPAPDDLADPALAIP